MNFYRSMIILLWLSLSCSALAQREKSELQILENEQWWAGVVTESHLMPLHEKTFEFDFYGNTAGNQGQPLLISNMGRFVWSEDPFKFKFENKTISLESRFGTLQIGRQGTTLQEVYRYVSATFFPPSGKIPAAELFTLPQFNTWIEFTYYQNQKGILEYARKIIESGFKPGVLMIDEGWFKSYGDWEFDPVRFPDPGAMMDELNALGFKVILWVCPYITSDGPYWKDLWLDYTTRGDTIWIIDAENPSFPAVMQWWDGFSNVVDLSNPRGQKWYRSKLDYLVDTYGVAGFKFDGGDAVHYSESRFLTKAKSFKKDITPNEHSELFVKLGLDYPFNEYRAAWKMGGQPIAMRLRDKRHDWEDLQKLVPGIIAQGLMGYPYTCPDMIGGGEYLSFIDLKNVDQELVVRAAQCHALMPMMQFSVGPWRVLSEKNLQICVDMANLHVELGQEILQLARQSANSGEPIVRSLDYEFPDKGYATITDQFLLGNSILVAPVVEQGARKRVIHFPPGRWQGDDGSIVKGPDVVEVKTPIERLPWYRKVQR